MVLDLKLPDDLNFWSEQFQLACSRSNPARMGL